MRNKPTTCTAPDCTKPLAYAGLCSMHYGRWTRHKNLDAGKPSLIERFDRQVNRDGPTSERAPHLGNCWTWTGNTFPSNGRPSFSPQGKRTLAYRWIYEFTNGPIPDGLTIDHLCFEPSCVRLDHLEVVTQAENNRRASREWQRGKTHCPHGHAYDTTNTYVDSYGFRHCKACAKARAARHSPPPGEEPPATPLSAGSLTLG